MSRTRTLRVLATLVMLATYWMTNALACTQHVAGTADGRLISVPGVVGDPEQIAVQCLQQYGFAPQNGGSEASDLPIGVVTRTDPGEGGGTHRIYDRESGPITVTYLVSSGRPSVTVPNVVGETQLAAMLQLRIEHLRLGEATEQTSDQSPGTIIAQAPEAGSSAERGSRVDIVLSAQWPQVPEVVGANEDDAKVRIRGHFAPRQAGTLPSEKSAGTVLKQEPVGGSKAPPGSDVSYWTASGQNYVPDVIGHDYAGAPGELHAAGFPLGAATQRVDLGKPNVVLEQRPAPKTLADVGTPVDVWISRELRVPDVVGSQEEEAVGRLKAASLQGQLSEESPSPEPRGKVLSTDPPANAKVGEGSLVRYRITSGKNIVPNLQGATTRSAASTLRDAGLRLGNQTARPTAGTIGMVLEQQPKAGEVLPIDSPVDVIVSSDLPIVPNVIGKAQSDAEAMIREAQFVPNFVGKEPSEKPAGTVLRTDPVGGTKASPQNVRYWAASGENRVPPLTDRTRAEAARDAAAQGFVLGDVAQRYAPASTGHVLEQRPAAGQMLALGSPIAVTLGSDTRWVPRLVGMTPEQATAALAKASLALGDRSTEYRFTDAGRVVSQRPAAGAQVAVGEAGEVAIVVAKGILVPIVAGSTLLAVLVLGTWWTQMRPWPWHWPPAVGMRAHLAPPEAPFPEFGPLDHDPTRDIRLRVVLVPGEPVFEQQPLPIVGIKVV